MGVRISLLALAGACFLALGAGDTLANHIVCGQTITTDTTLDSDLIDCLGDGIVIGAPNIELDLNGHTVDGDGAAPGIGINNSAGHDGVEIEHGTIQEFDVGVRLVGASRNELEGLNVTASTGDAAILLESSSGNRLARNTTSANAGHGIHLIGSNNNRLVRNTANMNEDGIDLLNSDNNRLEGNVASQNRDDGILLVSANLPGTSSSNNTLVQNRANGNVGTGFLLHVGDSNLLRRNTANGNTAQGMILIASDNNTLRLNTTSSNTGDGVLILSDSDGTLLDRNTANQNGTTVNLDDGLQTLNAATTFVGNIANNNADLGIEAVPGVTDGGGNKASGNGNPAQCTFVTCT